MPSTTYSPGFIEKLNELEELHEDARLAIALAEGYNPTGESFLGPHNELRNALFHVMEMIKGKNDPTICENEFRAARSHLRRAGCDAYELVCLICIEHICVLLDQYDHEDINIAIPNYYTEIRPRAKEVQNKVGELKMNKELIKQQGGDLFELFFTHAESLIRDAKYLDNNIVHIIDIQGKKKKKKWKEAILNIGIGVVIAAVFFFLGKLF